MYLPVQFRETDRARLLSFLDAHPLGLCVSTGPSGLQATPLPLVIHDRGDELRVTVHFARGNTQWRDLEQTGECLIVVQGADAYVSPSWYPTKQITHEHVPTWNYDMVQIRGTATVTSDEHWLREHVAELTNRHESVRAEPWDVSQAPDAYLEKMIHGIVGCEILVTEVQGKWKMNQNRLPEDAAGAYAGLANHEDPHHNPLVAERVLRENRDRIPQQFAGEG